MMFICRGFHHSSIGSASLANHKIQVDSQKCTIQMFHCGEVEGGDEADFCEEA
jgi:hypothetical protein